MALTIGTQDIIRDGLIVFLDPSSPKNYKLTEVEVLVVAGGGGGGTNGSANDIGGGGGGGGGVIYRNKYKVSPGSSYTIVVGEGGSTSQDTIPNGGGNSQFDNLIAVGGGRGAGYAAAAYYSATSGGSGGGGCYNQNSGGTGTSGQGNNGGRGQDFSSAFYGAGGGGGAGGRGQDSNYAQGHGGDGGEGLPFALDGATKYYGAGGGGGIGYRSQPTTTRPGRGGIDGGGRGSSNTNGLAGTANLGAGGGGAGNNQSSPYANSYGGAGGKGVVIVRYPGPQKASGGNSIFVNKYAGYTVHRFTDSGTFTVFSDTVQNGTSVYGLRNLASDKYNAYTVNGPQYNTDGGGSLYFNQSLDTMEIEDLDLRYNEYTVMAAHRYGTTASGRLISARYNNWLMGLWSTSTENYYAEGWITSSSGTGTSDTNWRITAATGGYHNDTWQMYVDGTLITENNGGTQGPHGFSFGRMGPSNQEYSDSLLGVFLVYDRVLTSDEINHNYNVLKNRYGI